jgi:agmatine/peptidylarginine deiminase
MTLRTNIESKSIPKGFNDKRRLKVTKAHRTGVSPGIIIGVFVCSLVICLVVIFSYANINGTREWKAYRIVPEYERFMKQVVISLAIRDKTLALHLELLKLLPDYTEIVMLLPKGSLQPIAAELKNQLFGNRTRLVAFNTERKDKTHFYFLFPEREKLMDSGDVDGTAMPQGTLWAQDLFKVATKPNGRTVLLVSDIYKWFNSYDAGSSLKVISDNSYVGYLSSIGAEIKKLPLVFNGGNVLVDEFGGKRIVICAGDVFRRTETVWKSTRNSTPTNFQITNMLKEFLNADEVVVVSWAKVQPSLLFHMDQAMIFLPNGVAGITHIVGRHPEATPDADEVKEVDHFLSELRSVLLRLGYKLVNIDTSIHNVLNHQYYVNAIPYIDAKTGQRTLLMPVFSSNETQFEKELVKKNTATFESLGYKVVHVPSEADKLNGGIHCLVNVLR